MKTFGQSEEAYRFLVESMPDMVWLARADGFIKYFNPPALDYLGLPGEEVCGWGWRKLVHPDDASQVQAAWDRAVKTGTPYEAEYRMRRNDGAYRWQLARSQGTRQIRAILYSDLRASQALPAPWSKLAGGKILQ
jgi:PAS domain S-box-containing protein